MNDVPTLTSATASNYAVLNPNSKSSPMTLANGNLQASTASGGAWSTATGTIGISSGKWYFESVWVSGAASVFATGYTTSSSDIATFVGGVTGSAGYFSNGSSYINNSAGSYGASYAIGDVIGTAIDMTAGTIVAYKNNVSQGTLISGLTGTIFVGLSSTNGSVLNINFGQQPFTYTPPSGYLSLNTYNLPTSTVPQGSKYMNAVLQLGSAINTGANLFAQSTYTYGLAWSADRSGTGSHVLVDTSRGTSNALVGNSAGAETTYGAPTSTDNFVAWVWNSSTAGVSNTNGSITSTVSASTTSGFSVVTYTGVAADSTVGHGLGVAPSMIIAKSRTNSGTNWVVYHTSLGINQLMIFTTSAVISISGYWGTSVPTSTVFGVKNSYDNNTGNMVAYCFAPIAGFSAFGSYVGNGSASGPFVYLGFRPKFLIIRYTGVESWFIFDTSRGTYNLSNPFIQINQYTETEYALDTPAMLSNGFALTSSNSSINGSGNTMIYMAFAENPFKYANAR
jgi:hypothetical protein